jgi:hypothetical protein
MPISGGAIQPATLPASVTRRIKLLTNARSSAEGSQSHCLAGHASSSIGCPSGSVRVAAQMPIERRRRVLGSRNRKSHPASATSRFRSSLAELPRFRAGGSRRTAALTAGWAVALPSSPTLTPIAGRKGNRNEREHPSIARQR